MALADAHALVPDLRAVEHDPAGEAKALAALADWCGRYSPWTAVDGIEADGAGGIWIDISGAAHLFGGEEALIADLTHRLDRLGYAVRAGLADTPGAAWALARFGVPAGAHWRLAPAGAEALAPLPVAGLRLAPEAHAGLIRLGLRTIGDVLPLPRAGLAARFGAEPVRRIDQALGRIEEPIAPRPPAPASRLRLAFPEPVARPEDVEAGARRLLAALCERLERAGRGVRRLELALYRVGGHVDRAAVGTSRASRDPGHLMRLLAASLERLPERTEATAESMVDLLVLAVLESQPLAPVQTALDRKSGDGGSVEDAAALAALNDRLVSRLGAAAVRQLRARASHLPERAQVPTPVGGGGSGKHRSSPNPAPSRGRAHGVGAAPEDPLPPCGRGPGWRVDKPNTHPGTQAGPRPVRLLAPPQPVAAMAPVPDDPPRLFRWQGRMYRVARADGPERLAPEWWRGPVTPGSDGQTTRDYYRVEDAQGRRFWLYREGLYGTGAAPRWFLHGLFG